MTKFFIAAIAVLLLAGTPAALAIESAGEATSGNGVERTADGAPLTGSYCERAEYVSCD